MRPKLTICIPSLSTRGASLAALLAALRAQPRAGEVEILVDVDDGRTPTGTKRTRLVAAARGGHVVHVDDDDMVAPNYIPAILGAIDGDPGVDAVVLRGRRTCPGEPVVEFDYRTGGVEAEFSGGVLWRSPGHLCPIRCDIAQAVPFPAATVGEDLGWGAAIRPRIGRTARAGRPGEVLYFYQWRPAKPPAPALGVPVAGHEAIFAPQYAQCSGPGSTEAYSRPWRAFLADFIRRHAIASVVDLGCGDMEIMVRTDLGGASYLGIDVVSARVALNRRLFPRFAFEHGDVRAHVPSADLVVAKDVIQHWATREILDWLGIMRTAPYRFALVVNCCYGPTTNTDIPTGGWRAIDLTKPPFSVGAVAFRWETKDAVLLRGARP